jgi:hypothetical protein
MKISQWLFAILGASTLVISATPAESQSSLRYIGRAVGGQSVTLDMNSIHPVSYRSIDFVYYLGNDERYSQANCEAGTWTTFEDNVVHRPQSDTTAEMIRIVCDAGGYTNQSSSASRWQVFAPPSNVRVSPNGPLQCVIRNRATINVYGWDGDWAMTDACGSDGYIHNSQIAPLN